MAKNLTQTDTGSMDDAESAAEQHRQNPHGARSE